MPAVPSRELPSLDSPLTPQHYLQRPRRYSTLHGPYNPLVDDATTTETGRSHAVVPATSNIRGSSYLQTDAEVDAEHSFRPQGAAGTKHRGSPTPLSFQNQTRGDLEQYSAEKSKANSEVTSPTGPSSSWTCSPRDHLAISAPYVSEFSKCGLFPQQGDIERNWDNQHPEESTCWICRRNRAFEVITPYCCVDEGKRGGLEHNRTHRLLQGREHQKSPVSRVSLVPRTPVCVVDSISYAEELRYSEPVAASGEPPPYSGYLPPASGYFGPSERSERGKKRKREDSQNRDSGEDDKQEKDGNDDGKGGGPGGGPPKKVPKKTEVACNFCRGRKLKCDGGRPACGNCVVRDCKCVYDSTVRRRGPGRKNKSMMAMKQQEELPSQQIQASSSVSSLASAVYRLEGPPPPDYPFPVGHIPVYGARLEATTSATGRNDLGTQQPHQFQQSTQQPPQSQGEPREGPYDDERPEQPFHQQQWQVPTQLPQQIRRHTHPQVRGREPDYLPLGQPSSYLGWDRETAEPRGQSDDEGEAGASESQQTSSPLARFDPTGHHRRRETG